MLDESKVMLWVVAVVILQSIVMLKICCITRCFSVGLILNIVNVTYVVVPYFEIVHFNNNGCRISRHEPPKPTLLCHF
jgi:hypothetical protein